MGDRFLDGQLFPGTPAFLTGKRYCIDGSALELSPDSHVVLLSTVQGGTTIQAAGLSRHLHLSDGAPKCEDANRSFKQA